MSWPFLRMACSERLHRISEGSEQDPGRRELIQQAAWCMNVMAGNAQVMERRPEGISGTCHLPVRISLKSRSDTRMGRIPPWN